MGALKGSPFAFGRTAAVVLVLTFIGFLLGAGISHSAPPPLKNPYHQAPRWKIWSLDPRPATTTDGATVAPIPEEKRTYPEFILDPKNPRRFIAFGPAKSGAKPEFAGLWDDVYMNLDKGHSYIRDVWKDNNGNIVNIGDQIIKVGAGNPAKFGVNFLSRSTTQMGHDLANNKDRLAKLEEFYYYANMIFAAPTHISLMERRMPNTIDEYEALSPVYYNSMGSSGSETMALTKMSIAGACMDRKLKDWLKVNGLYAATLLYLWKASLPYDVPFENELRHRVAYNSSGDHSDYTGGNRTEVNRYYHNYDETDHMRVMLNLARNLKSPPPVALVRVLDTKGGQLIYALKKTVLVHQDSGQTVRLRVSVEDSFDPVGRPMAMKWTVLYGNLKTKIEQEGNSPIFNITVPNDGKLPKGRTAIILTADNGMCKGNPAVINIFRTQGRQNGRPTLTGMGDHTILPGETVKFDIKSVDPEGFPVVFYRWANEVGHIEGNTFSWTCPSDYPDKDEPITVIASDRTCGSGYNSDQAHIRVRSTIAQPSADKVRGKAPFTVKFSSQGSRDKAGPIRSYLWNFDDGHSSKESDPTHVFESPGIYRVRLSVEGPSGRHEDTVFIEVDNEWKSVLFNGWNYNLPDKRVWDISGPINITPDKQGGLNLRTNDQKIPIYVTSRSDLTPPFYLEIIYKQEVYASQPGTGFRVMGLEIGHTNKPKAKSRDLALAYPIKKSEDKWYEQVVAQEVRFADCAKRIKLYVTPDINHPGRIRFRGVLECYTGRFFFDLDDMAPLDRKVAIMSGVTLPKFIVYRIIVTAPDGTEKAPKLNWAPRGLEPCAGTPQEQYSRSLKISP